MKRFIAKWLAKLAYKLYPSLDIFIETTSESDREICDGFREDFHVWATEILPDELQKMAEDEANRKKNDRHVSSPLEQDDEQAAFLDVPETIDES
jgi:hypothetical protein